jgi:ABC-type transport system involved in multi-copper enzyme maturation permease subunit
MFRNINTIQKAAFLEIARHPAYYIITFLFCILIFASQKLNLFSFRSEVDMIREMGFATLILWGVLSCILLSHQSLFAEMENRCAMTLLSKPIQRHAYVFGKYLGLARALFVGMLLLTIILILTLWTFDGLPELDRKLSQGAFSPIHFNHDDAAWNESEGAINTIGGFTTGIAMKTSTRSASDVVWSYFVDDFLAHNVWPVLIGGLLTFLQAALIASFALGLATYFPPEVVAVGTLTFYLIGHLSEFVRQALLDTGTVFSIVGQLICWALPNLEIFNPVSHLARGEPLSAIYVALALGYGILYGSAVLGTTAYAFSRRELP